MRSDYLEVSAVATRLNVSAHTVYRLIQRNKLESVNVGNKKAIRVLRSSLERFEENRKSQSLISVIY
ncbi:helix-turn-helix domain-containing protein [Desulfopila aestuarii]|uniref:DNA binding domain-containing protein, excisionase family n=1 Tax=Desulfopila aestuarii DSM 18488 TaxID=1121416 RepID=A0A1M7YJU2_9BACT|nr:DNA binding domain-containing protein, excisionase family [Desulfopila aestuarii DSM 18488]